ncbi:hypothetical protein MKW92_019308 [Papaver armeniacum]|nr:hypothetical protein MKW92_019308 [Papaver armeniacum]
MSKFIVFTLCLVLSILSFGVFIDGTRISNADAPIIKTIKSENGEIIDCYDLHRQPAFSNPLFRDHVIQMRPGSYPQGVHPEERENFKLLQPWHKYGSCPEKTIPVRRSGKNYQPNPITSSKHIRPSSSNDVPITKEYVVISPDGDNFQGAQADINIWKPLIGQQKEYSASQIWILSGGNEEAIEAGWEVNESLYGDGEPRFFVYWTADHYNSTGCYNIQCSGFVQTTSKFSLGSNFGHISTFNGIQYFNTFTMFKEQSSGNWWVQLEGITVGYWPHFLFKQLSSKATSIYFGGQVSNTQPNGQHTTTQMGSGHLPSEGGFGISSCFRKVKVLDGNYEAEVPEGVSIIKTNPTCYDLKLGETDSTGIVFYYGGPGFSGNCQ